MACLRTKPGEKLDSRGWARGLGRDISRAPITQVSAIFTVHKGGCPAAGPARLVARVFLPDMDVWLPFLADSSLHSLFL